MTFYNDKQVSIGLAVGRWLNERFPIVNFISGLIMYLMVVAVGQNQNFKVILTQWPEHLLGAVALTSLFLLLRIIDEHKDFDKDMISHPKRVLQSGQITLKDLRVIGLICILFQVFYTLRADQGLGATAVAYLVVLVWSFLMAKEFFVGEWLKNHLLLYALSHMLIAPASVIWILAGASKLAPLKEDLGWLITLPFFAGMVYEIARKLRGSEEESPNVDSYSLALGHKKATALLLFFSVAAVGNYILINEKLINGIDHDLYPEIAAAWVLVLVSAINYLNKNSKKSRKFVEGAVGLFILLMYVSLIVVAS